MGSGAINLLRGCVKLGFTHLNDDVRRRHFILYTSEVHKIRFGDAN